MKLNGATFKDFFLNHGEKLVFAAVATVLVGGAYSLVAHETYQKDPDSLVKNSTAAITHVKNSIWDADREKVVVIDPNALVDKAREPIPPEPWRLPNPFYRTGTRIGKARPAPRTVPALELEVSPGFGPIALLEKKRKDGAGPARGVPRAGGADPAGAGAAAAPGAGPKRPGGKDNTKPADAPAAAAGPMAGARKVKLPGVQVSKETPIQGMHWVCLRGVVPAKSQSDEFAVAFQGARWINEKEDQVHYSGFKVERAKVSPDDPNAPLSWEEVNVQKVWSTFEQRFAAVGVEVVDEKFLDEKLTSTLPPLVGRDWGNNGHDVAHKRFSPIEPEVEDEPAEEPEENEDPPANGNDPDDDDPDPKEAAPRKQPRPSLGNSVGRPHVTGHKPNEDFLFRFFDFSVKPHETYRYRISLILDNPNRNVPERDLESADLRTSPVLTTAFSEPSLPVEIPGEKYSLVGKATAGQSTVEPSIQTMVVVLDKKRGIEVAYDAKTVRGQAIDFFKQEVSFINPKSGANEKDTFDFLARAVLVDFKGGMRMPAPGRAKTIQEPSDAIYLTEDGRLMSLTELLNEPRYNQFLSEQQSEPVVRKPRGEREPKPGQGAAGASPFDLMPVPGAKAPGAKTPAKPVNPKKK